MAEHMVLLSIDIDFFVTPRATDVSLRSTRRLRESEHKVSDDAHVRAVLRQVGLTPEHRVPGVFVRDHDAAFYWIRSLVAERGPIKQLIHLDAHADLGLGDTSYVYLLRDLAHRPVARRSRPRRGRKGLNVGSWLPFVVANGWLENISFISRSSSVKPKFFPPTDLHPVFFREFPPGVQTQLEVVAATQEELAVITCQGADAAKRRAVYEHGSVVARAELEFGGPGDMTFTRPDHVIVCQSPQFTPRSADRVLDICQDFVAREPLPSYARAPVDWAPRSEKGDDRTG